MPFLPKGFEWIVILILVLIIFGPKNLPKLGKAIGDGLKGLRKGVESGKEKIDEKFEEVEVEKSEEFEAAQAVEVAESAGSDEIQVEVERISEGDAQPSQEGQAKRTVRVKRVVRDDAEDSE